MHIVLKIKLPLISAVPVNLQEIRRGGSFFLLPLNSAPTPKLM